MSLSITVAFPFSKAAVSGFPASARGMPRREETPDRCVPGSVDEIEPDRVVPLGSGRFGVAAITVQRPVTVH